MKISARISMPDMAFFHSALSRNDCKDVCDFSLRLNLPHALSSTIACITLRPSPKASHIRCAKFSPDEVESSTRSQNRWLATSFMKLRQLSDAPLVIRGSFTESGTPVINVLCPKTSLVAIFKVIAAAKNELNVAVDNKAVQLQLQQPELQAAAINVLQTTLTEAGWSPLSSMMFVSEFQCLQTV